MAKRLTLMLAAAVAAFGAWADVPTISNVKVQLWEGGPYWATTNIGAENPEDYGYYFWWGDTVGYTNTGSGWISVKDGTIISFSDSGTAASTCGKGTSASASIFLPCAGYGYGTSLNFAGSNGHYWSSVPGSDNYNAWIVYFYSSDHNTYYYDRYYGQSVRPVQGFTN